MCKVGDISAALRHGVLRWWDGVLRQDSVLYHMLAAAVAGAALADLAMTLRSGTDQYWWYYAFGVLADIGAVLAARWLTTAGQCVSSIDAVVNTARENKQKALVEKGACEADIEEALQCIERDEWGRHKGEVGEHVTWAIGALAFACAYWWLSGLCPAQLTL